MIEAIHVFGTSPATILHDETLCTDAKPWREPSGAACVYHLSAETNGERVECLICGESRARTSLD